MANFFQQAKQAMELRHKMKKIQKDLENKVVEYENGGVKVKVSCDMTVKEIKFDTELVALDKLDKFERLILDNTNKALKLAKDEAAKYSQTAMREMGGLGDLLGGM
jgi:DNA-binding protein YbaB